MAIRNSKGQFTKENIGINHQGWKGKSIEYICLLCNKVFRRYGSNKPKYCSKECANKASIGRHFKWSHKRTTPVWNKGKKWPELSGKNNPAWKGGSINDSGYRVFGHKKEHRIIVENHLGRKLNRKEHVHHLDGNKLNNDISNLIVLTPTAHALLHHKIKTYDKNKKRFAEWSKNKKKRMKS